MFITHDYSRSERMWGRGALKRACWYFHIKGLFELDDESLTISRAQERIELEASYRRMQTQLKTAELSQDANEHFDNQQAAASFKQRVSAIKADMQHCLRGIKYLDEKYPDVRDYIRKRKAKGLKL